VRRAGAIKCYFDDIELEKKGKKARQRSYSPVKGDIISPVKKEF
jgi:hypothetical protein